MFSQFRQAVETFVPQPRNSVDGEGGPGNASSGQLAENGLSNLRKSLASQRSGSPAPKSTTATKKFTLEERLRGAVAGTSHDSSTRVSPSPSTSVSSTVIKDHPLSPTSTPLPESRPISPPTTEPQATPPPEIPFTQPTAEVSSSVTEESSKPTVETPQDDPIPSNPTQAEPVTEPPETAVNETPAVVNDDTNVQVPPEHEKLAPTSSDETQNVADAGETTNEPAATIVGAEKATTEESVSSSVPLADSQALPEQQRSPSSAASPTVEELQERLQLVERRFNDVSTSFKRLQAEKLAADAVIKEFTPLESFQANGALREYFQNMKLKIEISQDEIKRLNGKLERQEDRIEEMRDTHRLESSSQSDQIDSLRKQLLETDALLKASQGSTAQGEDQLASRKTEIERLQKEVEKAKDASKEEEEKRVKAISLLKTVRQKLVKAEKDKEEAVKELTTLREQGAVGKAQEDAEKARLKAEIESANAEREKAVSGLKSQFDKELSLAKDRYEKEMSAMKGQFELEVITLKNSHAKELSQKSSQVSSLEEKLQGLTRDKNEFFDQLQLRQAEMESYQSRADSLQSENVELLHQVRELEDRLALVREELMESRREMERQSREESGTSEEAARMLSAMEAKYEARISELKRVVNNVEKDRTESEAEWVRKLREKNKEVEELKGKLGSASRLKEKDESMVDGLKAEIERLKEELSSKESSHRASEAITVQLKERESSMKSKFAELEAQIKALETTIEEGANREAQLRSGNKTLREELRKVQSSVALLDRQRNPGVGYWTSKDNSATDSRVSISSNSSDGPSKERPSSGTTKDDEEVNLEYLRNVIFQFLEHKEMRPNLVKVLSVILHFTPQETRRLMAKI